VPTCEALPRFTTDLDRLTPEQRRRFRRTVAAFVEDLRRWRSGIPPEQRSPRHQHRGDQRKPGNIPEPARLRAILHELLTILRKNATTP
jgi:hypothetical protein